MSTFTSDEGVWHPAKEKVALTNHSGKTITLPDGTKVKDGEPFIYSGPDRGALIELHERGEESLGSNFRTNPEFLQAIRNMGFQNVEEYLKSIGYDSESEKARFKKISSVVTKHELPKRAKMVKDMGGGQDTAGGGLDRWGGFGEHK